MLEVFIILFGSEESLAFFNTVPLPLLFHNLYLRVGNFKNNIIKNAEIVCVLMLLEENVLSRIRTVGVY